MIAGFNRLVLTRAAEAVAAKVRVLASRCDRRPVDVVVVLRYGVLLGLLRLLSLDAAREDVFLGVGCRCCSSGSRCGS